MFHSLQGTLLSSHSVLDTQRGEQASYHLYHESPTAPDSLLKAESTGQIINPKLCTAGLPLGMADFSSAADYNLSRCLARVGFPWGRTSITLSPVSTPGEPRAWLTVDVQES